MSITCHNRKLKTDEYSITTKHGKEFNYLYEYITVAQCSVCGTKIIEHSYQKIDKHKQLIQRNAIHKGKSAVEFEKTITNKEQRYKAKEIDRRMFLLYADKGTVKKCYSNLSTLKIGLIDYDQGLREALNV